MSYQIYMPFLKNAGKKENKQIRDKVHLRLKMKILHLSRILLNS